MRQSIVLEDLRARIAHIKGVGGRSQIIPFGLPAIDCKLPGGGLATGVLHDIAGSPAPADDASVIMFLAGILAGMEGRSSGACAGATCSPRRFISPDCIPTG